MRMESWGSIDEESLGGMEEAVIKREVVWRIEEKTYGLWEWFRIEDWGGGVVWMMGERVMWWM